MPDTTSENVLNVICDSLHYPEFNAAWDNLNGFEQKSLSAEIDEVVSMSFKEGYEEADGDFSVGFEHGKSEMFESIFSTLYNLVTEEEYTHLFSSIQSKLKKDEN